MNLTTLSVGQSADQSLSISERALYRCQMAKQLEKAGEYEAAYEAIREFWPERNGSPMLEGLDQAAKARTLLRIGALAGWLGSAHQTRNSQETAKDLITQSIRIFDESGQSEGIAEARSDLALCYWREGAFDEARINLAEALGLLKNDTSGLRAVTLIRAGLVEKDSQRLREALPYYKEAEPLVEQSDDDALKGAFHNEFDYTDWMLGFENNLGYLFYTIREFEEAHTHLNRARRLFLDLEDIGGAAGVDDTRALSLMAEGRLNEAERFAQGAVKTLDRGGEQWLLAEALTTHGTVLARMGKIARAKAALQRAIEVAQTSGDLERAGLAYVSIIEELGRQISVEDLVSNYKTALDLLRGSHNPATTKRLISCAQTVIGALDVPGNRDEVAPLSTSENNWDGFSFKQQVLDYEREIISRALRDTSGAVTKAARLLGFNHHQSLIALINSRHKGLLGVRSAVRKRRRSIIKIGQNESKKRTRSAKRLTAAD